MAQVAQVLTRNGGEFYLRNTSRLGDGQLYAVYIAASYDPTKPLKTTKVVEDGKGGLKLVEVELQRICGLPFAEHEMLFVRIEEEDDDEFDFDNFTF